jgi:hypothetical protein
MSFGGDIFPELAAMQAAIEAFSIRLRYPDVINIEDAEKVEIGQTYFVNVATTRKDSAGLGASFPVLGDAHDDADFIPVFPDQVWHFHVDWRFIPTSLYAQVVKMCLQVYGHDAAQYREYGPFDPATPNLQLAVVLPASAIVSVQRWPLPCARQQLKWEAYPDWLPRLEMAFKDKKVECNTCPHRGISLVGAPTDEHGNRICAGHGLKWNRSGRLVPRTRK